MISDDPEVYDHSGQEGVVGNVNIGLGSTLHDDEDLFDGEYDYSGDGSGYSGDRGIDTVIETGNGEVSFPDNKPNRKYWYCSLLIHYYYWGRISRFLR